ncbi:MAG: hypothetical protein COX19_04810 [Desulfobacterales bacterium CG23_combo_of_CG06-09_8_20_14_all_51_8]|nr:MAG: hypothetical protein COX19_04810 [Desulfobacterales bacterium CG23_combo_of_CG06-09_8_20_14_all_51_8]
MAIVAISNPWGFLRDVLSFTIITHHLQCKHAKCKTRFFSDYYAAQPVTTIIFFLDRTRWEKI